jgi:leucyl-tRNA synthetase
VTVGRIEAMSKSKRNTVDPGAIIDRYGADTARWFILSTTRPSGTWSGPNPAWWAPIASCNVCTAWPRQHPGRVVGASRTAFRPAALALRRSTHRTIAAVTVALETFAFNVAVARIYELAGAIAEADKAATSQGMAFARPKRWKCSRA